jgi:hypothetical protein
MNKTFAEAILEKSERNSSSTRVIPAYLKQPFDVLMDKIRKGQLASEIVYSSLEKSAFQDQCLAANEKYTVQLKYDGWFSCVTPEGVYSKTGQLKTTEIRTSDETILIAELMIGTQWSLNHLERGSAIVHGANVENVDLPNKCRWIESYDPVYVVANWDSILGNFEGFVLKNVNTGSFWRWKKPVHGDYVIIRCIPSDAGTLKGWACGSVEIGLYIDGKLTSMGTAGGFDHVMKKDMFDHPEKYVGKVVQLTGKAIFTSGRLRHPSWDRIREDKLPEQCTMKQFEGLI